MVKKRNGGRLNWILLYALAGILVLLAVWQVAKELVIGFNLTEEALPAYGQTVLGWDDLRWTDDLQEGSVRAYLYEGDGAAAASVFTKGLFGKYRLAASLAPGEGARELLVNGTEERFSLSVQAGQPLVIQGDVQQQSWFGMVVIDLILCGIALFTGRKQQKAEKTGKTGADTGGEM